MSNKRQSHEGLGNTLKRIKSGFLHTVQDIVHDGEEAVNKIMEKFPCSISDDVKTVMSSVDQTKNIVTEVENNPIWKEAMSHELSSDFSLFHLGEYSESAVNVVKELDAKMNRSDASSDATANAATGMTADAYGCTSDTKSEVTSGLFGFTGYQPFEIPFLRKKPELGSQAILTATDGSYTWGPGNITGTLSAVPSNGALVVDNIPNYNALPSEEQMNGLGIFGARALQTVIAEATLRLDNTFHFLSEATDSFTFDAPSTIGPCLKSKGLVFDCDQAFGLQRFQGALAHRVTVAKKEDLPEDLKGKFDLGLKYCILDYSDLGKYALTSDMKLQPKCIFQYNNWGNILPEEISLGNGVVMRQSESISFPWKWRYFKMVTQCAEFTHHELVDHLTYCHLLTEIIIMETMRQWRHTTANSGTTGSDAVINNGNIVYRLLVPHFARTLAVNNGARQLLIPWIKSHLTMLTPDAVDQLVNDKLTSFDFNDLDFNYNLRKRGFDEDNLPASYFYANDGIQLWRTLLYFVNGVLKDANLDWGEINSWSTNIRIRLPTFPLFQYNSQIDDLARMIAGIIFNASIQHSAVNDTQWYFWGYALNSPATLLKTVPSQEQVASMTDDDWQKLYFASLPSEEALKFQRDLVSLLALGPPDHSSLVQCIQEYRQFLSDVQVNKLQAGLMRISSNIVNRNEYTWLDPNKVTRSVIR